MAQDTGNDGLCHRRHTRPKTPSCVSCDTFHKRCNYSRTSDPAAPVLTPWDTASSRDGSSPHRNYSLRSHPYCRKHRTGSTSPQKSDSDHRTTLASDYCTSRCHTRPRCADRSSVLTSATSATVEPSCGHDHAMAAYHAIPATACSVSSTASCLDSEVVDVCWPHAWSSCDRELWWARWIGLWLVSHDFHRAWNVWTNETIGLSKNVCLAKFFLAATGRTSISEYRLVRAAQTNL